MSFRKGRPEAAASADRPRAARTDETPRSIYDILSIAVIAVLGVLVCATFRDYGITTDEYVQQVYGEKLWDFFLSGFRDRSAFTFDNLYLYGGLFDMVAVPLQALSPFEPYETRHLLSGLTGVAGVFVVWRLGRLLAGPRSGFLAAALLGLCASWYGAMFNNTKDIPFAVAMTSMLYLGCRMLPDLPRPPWPIVVAFGIALGLALGLRVGALLGLFCLLAAAAVQIAAASRGSGWRSALRGGLIFVGRLLPAFGMAYGLMALFWPWSVLSLLNPLHAISGLTQFTFRTELGNEYFPANQLPALYLPMYIAIKLPEVVLVGCLATLAAVNVRIFRRGRSVSGSSQGGEGQVGAAWRPGGWSQALLLALWVVVPIAYFVIGRPSLYNGMRHFFFVVPPLCVVAAVGLDRLLFWTTAWRRSAGVVTAGLLLLAAADEVATIRSLHPHQYIYYNALVRGPGGAFRRYEMDYWSNFLPEALALLERRLRSEQNGRMPTRRYTVGLCTREEILAEYAPPFLTAIKDWKRADFIITTTNTDCDLFASGRTIIEVSRDGAVLGVVKDRRPGMTAQGTTTAAPIR